MEGGLCPDVDRYRTIPLRTIALIRSDALNCDVKLKYMIRYWIDLIGKTSMRWSKCSAKAQSRLTPSWPSGRISGAGADISTFALQLAPRVRLPPPQQLTPHLNLLLVLSVILTNHHYGCYIRRRQNTALRPFHPREPRGASEASADCLIPAIYRRYQWRSGSRQDDACEES